MLHMQHAHVVSLLVRQHEAAIRKARADALANARRAAATATGPEGEPVSLHAPKVRVNGPRPA